MIFDPGLCGMAMREGTTWGNAMYIYLNATASSLANA